MSEEKPVLPEGEEKEQYIHVEEQKPFQCIYPLEPVEQVKPEGIDVCVYPLEPQYEIQNVDGQPEICICP